MTHYKIAMLGLGSIGKRHLKNIHSVLKARGLSFSVDVIRRPSSRPLEKTLSSLIDNVYTNINDVPSDYDILFITNPTHKHYESLANYKDKAKHMFIEKPVFDDDMLDVAHLKLSVDSVYYVACPLRYTGVIEYAKHHINLNDVYSARAISSSYLPDWRPNQDYRTTYSAHLDQGGGVSIDLIHEWDYLIYLFGFPLAVHNFRGTLSHLEIDSDDLSVYIARYADKLVELHLDYIGRTPIRKLELYMKNDTVEIDLIKSTVTYLKEDRRICFDEDRNAYQLKETMNFFDIVEGRSPNDNSVNTAIKTLKLAKRGRV